MGSGLTSQPGTKVHNLYYNGSYKPATNQETFQSFHPGTGQVCATVAKASDIDVDMAVRSAYEAYILWRQMTGVERGRILAKTAALLRKNLDELANLETLDTGKPIRESLEVDITSGADCLEYFAGVAPTLHGSHVELANAFSYIRREPLGVCAGLGAWNYPLQIACWKAAPALACGNTMVFKPAEQTPLSALRLAELFSEAGLPPGVFNVVQGDGAVGKALVDHPLIAKVSLTGSVGTGRQVMVGAAQQLKPVTLELGGKSPLIIFDDADLDQACDAAMAANFYTQGEICSNGTRVFVAKNVASQFEHRLLEKMGDLKVGDPFDPKTDIGALISQEHYDSVLSYIDRANKSGAAKVCGGQRVDCNGGWFVEPTVYSSCNDEMTHVREEIFGPVMSILSFDNEVEVVRRANDTQFGLAAGVFTKDLKRAHRLAAALEAGIVWINNYNITPIEVPFGGYKCSGLGRENGLAATEFYTQLKTVYVELGEVKSSFGKT